MECKYCTTEIYNFSSVQIDLPQEIAQKVILWGDKNIDDEDLYEFGRELDPHITVFYGLHNAKSNIVTKVLRGFEHFYVTLGEVSTFTTNDNFDVVKVEVYSKELHRMHTMLKRLPHTQKYPDYKPHVTIAYVRKNYCRCITGSFTDVNFKVENVFFSSTTGKKTKIKLNEFS